MGKVERKISRMGSEKKKGVEEGKIVIYIYIRHLLE